jgi:hypothetical protein
MPELAAMKLASVILLLVANAEPKNWQKVSNMFILFWPS